MTTKFNQELYARMKAKKNEPLSNIGQRRLKVVEKDKEQELTEKGLSSPTLDEGRPASPDISIKEVVLPTKKWKMGDKEKEKIGSSV